MIIAIEITIPVLNEEASLARQIRKVHDFIESNLQDIGSFTIIIADNGSTDNTQKIAESLAGEMRAVEYVRLEQRGVGQALKNSWTKSSADIIGYFDLDLATDLRYLRPALEALISKKSDIVTGSRLAKGAKVIGRKPLRNFTSICFNYLVKFTFHTSFSDGMCGFKFMQRSKLESLMATGAKSDGWFFATEILVSGEYLKYNVMDLPVTWTDDPSSKVKIIKLTIEYLTAILSLRQRLNQLKLEK